MAHADLPDAGRVSHFDIDGQLPTPDEKGALAGDPIPPSDANRYLTQNHAAGGFDGFANPTASVGLVAVNGVATTAMRSDGAPALDQGIIPTWTGLHTFLNGLEAGDVVGGNFTHIESDGTVEFNGNATVWNDIYFPMSSGRIGGANQPTWAAFQGNTFEYTFAINDYIHLPSGEIAHSYKQGSDIKLHVHIVLDGSDAGDTDVNYEIEYTIGDMNEVMSAAALATSGDYTITGGTADRTHLFIQVGTIAGAALLVGAALKMRFRRIALVGGGNAPSNDPFVLMVGVHIEEDTVGSRTETTK